MPSHQSALPRVFLFGDLQHSEFAEVIAWLQVRALEDSLTPTWIVCFQSRPGQISQDEIEQLHRSLPLAGLVMVLGSWCEGETRSGQPCHGMDRCYWYDAIAHLTAIWQSTPSPRTVTLAERLEHPSIAKIALRISIHSRRKLQREVLAEAIRALQGTIWEDSHPSPDMWLIDGEDMRDGWTLAEAQTMYLRWPTIPGIALMNFPRDDERKQLANYGIKTVLGKPWHLAELQAAIIALAKPDFLAELDYLVKPGSTARQ